MIELDEQFEEPDPALVNPAQIVIDHDDPLENPRAVRCFWFFFYLRLIASSLVVPLLFVALVEFVPKMLDADLSGGPISWLLLEYFFQLVLFTVGAWFVCKVIEGSIFEPLEILLSLPIYWLLLPIFGLILDVCITTPRIYVGRVIERLFRWDRKADTMHWVTLLVTVPVVGSLLWTSHTQLVPAARDLNPGDYRSAAEIKTDLEMQRLIDAVKQGKELPLPKPHGL